MLKRVLQNRKPFYVHVHVIYVRMQMGAAGGPDPPPPLKNHKNINFASNTGPDTLKNRSYQASIQCWAIIGTSAKRRANDGPLIVVLGSFLPSSTKKKKRCQSWAPLIKLSGSAHEITKKKSGTLGYQITFTRFSITSNN